MNIRTKSRWLDVTDFGALGDGETDDTQAFRTALAEAGRFNGTVFVPDGVYLCGELQIPPHTGLVGNANWGYLSEGGSVLHLNDPAATCLINMTGAFGSTVHGLSLHGEKLGTGIHGIYTGPCSGKSDGDALRIERCHIMNFTGNGVCLEPIWCFSVRSSEIICNDGHGIYVNGWDGFILDNWLSSNGGSGYCADKPNSAITMTGNRIEWNRDSGIRVLGGAHYNITGNYIDRSGGPGITLLPRPGAACFCFTVIGNIISRSGRPEWTGEELSRQSAQVHFEGCHGLAFTGNSMCVGQDDGSGEYSPQYGVVLRNLKNCVVKDNTLHNGALKELCMDLGEHQEGVIITDNVGSIYTDLDNSIWGSDQR